jgi:hypothetical protein
MSNIISNFLYSIIDYIDTFFFKFKTGTLFCNLNKNRNKDDHEYDNIIQEHLFDNELGI